MNLVCLTITLWFNYQSGTLWEMTVEMITEFMRCNMHDLLEFVYVSTYIYHATSLYS